MGADNQFFKQVTNMLKKSKRSFDQAMRFSEAIQDPVLRENAEKLIREYRKDFNQALN